MSSLQKPQMSRRNFLRAAGAACGTGSLGGFRKLIAAETSRHKIKSLQTMTIAGPQRAYVLVKITSESGIYGLGEAYGTPNIGAKEQIKELEPLLVGKDPLEIDVLYTFLGEHDRDLSGTRTDGSAHNEMRAASGIEMALWDLGGKILGAPTSSLLGGRFREKVRVLDHAAPRNMLDKESCKEWAAKVRAHPSGFTAHKFSFTSPSTEDNAKDNANRALTTQELIKIGQGFENCREAIGWDHDIVVHCHWQYDLRASIELANAVAPIKPLWLEDPLVVDYSDSWKRLTEVSPVPIGTGENLERRQGFKDFIINQGCDILQPDLRNSGGFLETKRIADLADIFGLPMANHNTGSQLLTWATCQWASSIRDYLVCETVTGEGGWMDQLLILDGLYIQDGHLRVTDKPGLGVDIDPDVAKAHLALGETWWN